MLAMTEQRLLTMLPVQAAGIVGQQAQKVCMISWPHLRSQGLPEQTLYLLQRLTHTQEGTEEPESESALVRLRLTLRCLSAFLNVA